jgi:hypothetical protein
LEKVVVLVTLSTKKIGFAIFGFFYELIMNLQVTGSNHKTGKNLFALGTLELLKLSQIDPWFPAPPLDLMAAACSPAARWGMGS